MTSSISIPLYSQPKLLLELNTLSELCLEASSRKVGSEKSIKAISSSDLDTILKQIKRIGITLSITSFESATLTSRVKYLGEKLKSTLTTKSEFDHLCPPHAKIESVLKKIAKIKNALQVESYIFSGALSALKLSNALNCKIVNEAQRFDVNDINSTLIAMPDLRKKTKIIANHTFNGFSVDISSLIQFFNPERLEETSADFDKIMFTLLSIYKISKGNLYIPIKKFPHYKSIYSLLRHEEEEVRPLGKLLYACYLECRLREENQFGIETLKLILDSFSESYLEEPYNLKVDDPKAVLQTLPYFEYLKKGQIAPFLQKTLELRNTFALKNEPLSNVLFSQDDVSSFLEDIPLDWEQEPSCIYQILLELQSSLSQLYDLKEYQKINKKLDISLCDRRVKESYFEYKKILKSYNPTFPNIFNHKEAFCQSVEEFEKIRHIFSFSSILEPPTERCKEYDERVDESEEVISTKLELLKSEITGVSTLQDSTKETRALESSRHEEIQKPALDEARESKILLSSITLTQEKLKTISLHPRVSAWMRSPEDGIRSREPEKTYYLTYEEMVLRHRFPKQILALAMNEYYSKKSLWDDREGYDHFESLLYIDGKKYILEVTLSPDQTLFHLYARPLKSLLDYYPLASDSPSEFPALGAIPGEPISVTSLDITFLPSLNASFVQDGHVYELAILKQLSFDKRL